MLPEIKRDRDARLDPLWRATASGVGSATVELGITATAIAVGALALSEAAHAAPDDADRRHDQGSDAGVTDRTGDAGTHGGSGTPAPVAGDGTLLGAAAPNAGPPTGHAVAPHGSPAGMPPASYADGFDGTSFPHPVGSGAPVISHVVGAMQGNGSAFNPIGSASGHAGGMAIVSMGGGIMPGASSSSVGAGDGAMQVASDASQPLADLASFVNSFQDPASAAFGLGSGALNGVAGTVSGALQGVDGAATGLQQSLDGVIGDAPQRIDNAVAGVQHTLDQTIAGTQQVLGGTLDGVRQVADVAGTTLGSTLHDASQVVSGIDHDLVGPAVGSLVSGTIGGTLQDAGHLTGTIDDAASTLVQPLGVDHLQLADPAGTVTSTLSGLSGNLGGALGDLGHVGDSVHDATSGVEHALDPGNLSLDGVTGAVGSTLGSVSDSLGDGLGNSGGIPDTVQNATNDISHTLGLDNLQADGVTGAVGSTLNGLSGSLGGALGDSHQGDASALGSVVDNLTGHDSQSQDSGPSLDAVHDVANTLTQPLEASGQDHGAVSDLASVTHTLADAFGGAPQDLGQGTDATHGAIDAVTQTLDARNQGGDHGTDAVQDATVALTHALDPGSEDNQDLGAVSAVGSVVGDLADNPGGTPADAGHGVDAVQGVADVLAQAPDIGDQDHGTVPGVTSTVDSLTNRLGGASADAGHGTDAVHDAVGTVTQALDAGAQDHGTDSTVGAVVGSAIAQNDPSGSSHADTTDHAAAHPVLSEAFQPSSTSSVIAGDQAHDGGVVDVHAPDTIVPDAGSLDIAAHDPIHIGFIGQSYADETVASHDVSVSPLVHVGVHL